MISLLIADDHPLYRDALKGALSMGFEDLTILESGDLNETVSTLEKSEVDLLLLDLHMPGSSDLFGFLHIQKLHPDLPIAVVSGTEASGCFGDKVVCFSSDLSTSTTSTAGDDSSLFSSFDDLSSLCCFSASSFLANMAAFFFFILVKK